MRTLRRHAKRVYWMACNGDETAIADIRAYAKSLHKNKARKKFKSTFMKKLIAPVAVLVLALATSGCMANLATKRFSNNLPQFIDALGRDTNACHLRIISPAFTLEFDRNGVLNAPPSAASFSVTPTTTLQVQPTR